MFKGNIQETKVKRPFTTSLCFVVAALVLILSACSTSSNPTTATTSTASTGSPSGQQPGDFGLAVLPGYQVSLFATQPSGITRPNPLVVHTPFLYIHNHN